MINEYNKFYSYCENKISQIAKLTVLYNIFYR